jgi:hypothetical protein
MQTQTEEKSSSKLYWIFGGIAVLILGGGFLAIALSTGIYLYASSKEDGKKIVSKENPEVIPDPKTKDSSEETSEKESGTFVKLLEDKYSTIGAFKLVEAKPFKSPVFSLSSFIVVGNYKEPKSKDVLSHWYVSYDDWETTKNEVLKRLDEAKKSDPKMKPEVKDDTIFSLFIMSNRINRLSCKNREGKGTCDLVTSRDPDSLLRYWNAYKKHTK